MCLYINYCHKSKFLLADCALQHVMIVKTVMPLQSSHVGVVDSDAYHTNCAIIGLILQSTHSKASIQKPFLGTSQDSFAELLKNRFTRMHAGIAIGGDVFPGSTLSDHCLRYQNIPDIKLIVVLGELGGHDEYSLVDALKSGQISKPVVAWVSGTCAKLFKSEVQFGHAGAKSGGASESAQVSNIAPSCKTAALLCLTCQSLC